MDHGSAVHFAPLWPIFSREWAEVRSLLTSQSRFRLGIIMTSLVMWPFSIKNLFWTILFADPWCAGKDVLPFDASRTQLVIVTAPVNDLLPFVRERVRLEYWIDHDHDVGIPTDPWIGTQLSFSASCREPEPAAPRPLHNPALQWVRKRRSRELWLTVYSSLLRELWEPSDRWCSIAQFSVLEPEGERCNIHLGKYDTRKKQKKTHVHLF